MTDYTKLIDEVFAQNDLSELINADSKEKLNMLINNLLEVNRSMNLTAITDAEGVVLKHVADSASIIKYIPSKAKLLDVGTGAGFPALPIAVIRPDVSVYALDSTAKKLKYVDDTSKLLSLDNVKTVTGRAEVLGNSVNYRQRFDVVTARAVSSLNVLSELCIPFVKVGGMFISMKGSAAPEELADAKSGVIQLGGSKFEDNELTLSFNDVQLQRHIIISKKVKNTPESFPRMYNRIIKKPL